MRLCGALPSVGHRRCPSKIAHGVVRCAVGDRRVCGEAGRLFKARLGPYAKPLTVWTAVACVCGVVQIPLMAVGFGEEGGENIEIVSLAVNAIFMCYFFYVLCRIVPKVKVLLDAVPEEELAAERYYILSPGPAGGTVAPDDSSPAGVEMAMTPTTAAAATT